MLFRSPSGRFARRQWPLALMVSIEPVPIRPSSPKLRQQLCLFWSAAASRSSSVLLQPYNSAWTAWTATISIKLSPGPLDLATRHHRPANPGGLVSHGDGDATREAALEHRFGPWRASIFTTLAPFWWIWPCRQAKSDAATDRKSTRLNSSHPRLSRMPSSA